MNAAVLRIEYTIVARTRDECIDLMDQTQLGILDRIGGAPWVAVDDDIAKMHNPAVSMCDDQGFLYQGKRSCHFQGPILDTGTQTYHDGFKPQMQVAREEG